MAMSTPLPSSAGCRKRRFMTTTAALLSGKHLLLCRIESRPPKLDLASYPYLPRANVEATLTASDMSLMSEAAD